VLQSEWSLIEPHEVQYTEEWRADCLRVGRSSVMQGWKTLHHRHSLTETSRTPLDTPQPGSASAPYCQRSVGRPPMSNEWSYPALLTFRLFSYFSAGNALFVTSSLFECIGDPAGAVSVCSAQRGICRISIVGEGQNWTSLVQYCTKKPN